MPAGLLLKDGGIGPSLNLPRVFELYWGKAQANSFSALKD
jgi:hypothetical protein